jgi:hypothetical protein
MQQLNTFSILRVQAELPFLNLFFEHILYTPCSGGVTIFKFFEHILYTPCSGGVTIFKFF